jgi:uncharacterized protein (DUF3084 family)
MSQKESILRLEPIVEDLQKQLRAETIECKCANEQRKVVRTKEHAVKAGLQKESRRHETLLAKKQLATLTALRRSKCESKGKRPTQMCGNGSHILATILNPLPDKSDEVRALQKEVRHPRKLDAGNKDLK